MKRILLTLVLLSGFLQSQACLNYYYSVDKHGHLHHTQDIHRAFNTNFNLKLIESKLLKLETKLQKDGNYQMLSDYAVLLLKSGKVKESLNLLVELARLYPNEYKIAANLGTAYEVNGQLDSALFYIKKGIQLNSNAHEGSEWVHVRVLETKLKLLNETDYLISNSVLQLSKKEKNDTLVRNQLFIQVRERFPFSPGPNAIMTSLVVDLADCYANTTSIEYAKSLYTIAKLYFGANAEEMDVKISEMITLRAKYANVKPEHRPRHSKGTNEKLTGLRYKTLLDDNNNPPHQVNWKTINYNVSELLAYVNIKPRVSQNNEVQESNVGNQNTDESASENDGDEKNKTNLIVLFAGVIFYFVMRIYFKRKREAKIERD